MATSNATSPTVNRGGGGGASAGGGGVTASNGASGVVILKYPDVFTATFSGGVTQTTAAPSGGFKVSTITAAGVSDTVSWA
jgi:hypothetical protein